MTVLEQFLAEDGLYTAIPLPRKEERKLAKQPAKRKTRSKTHSKSPQHPWND